MRPALTQRVVAIRAMICAVRNYFCLAVFGHDLDTNREATVIPPKAHAVIDYIVGALLIAAPYLLGFADGGPAQWVPMILGAGTIVYSLVTQYELSVAKLIPYRAHLGIDAVAGVVLLASPWLFGFAQVIWWPHVVVGIAEIGVVAMSWGAASRPVVGRTS